MSSPLLDATCKAFDIHGLCQGLELLIDDIKTEPSPASAAVTVLARIVTNLAQDLAIQLDELESDARRNASRVSD